MSVQKLDSVKLRNLNKNLPYTIHSNYVLQNVKDCTALAIWCYLTSLPDDWVVHRNQLMDHFDIGRDKLGAALKYLNENKLIEYIQYKDEAGKFTVSHIVVKDGLDFEVIHRKTPALLKNRTTDLPDTGKTAPTNTIRNTNTKKDTYSCSSNDKKISKEQKSEPRQAAKFWEPGNPDYDRVNQQ